MESCADGEVHKMIIHRHYTECVLGEVIECFGTKEIIFEKLKLIR